MRVDGDVGGLSGFAAYRRVWPRICGTTGAAGPRTPVVFALRLKTLSINLRLEGPDLAEEV